MQPTSNQILRELAQDGNPAAIATLLNQILQSHQIIVKTSIHNGELKIVLLSEAMTDKSIILFLLRKEISQISSKFINKIKIHCHKKLRYFSQNKYKEVINYNLWIHQESISNPEKSNLTVGQKKV